MLLLSVKRFIEDYDSIYEQAEQIFNNYNICQWKKNTDGSFSCIINRVNTKKNNFRIIETDGCCMDICKRPKDYCDKVIIRKQHNGKIGCLIKSLKCKLHICIQLRNSGNRKTREAIKNIDLLINIFRLRYDILWKCIPYGSSKKIWIEFYKKVMPSAGHR